MREKMAFRKEANNIAQTTSLLSMAAAARLSTKGACASRYSSGPSRLPHSRQRPTAPPRHREHRGGRRASPERVGALIRFMSQDWDPLVVRRRGHHHSSHPIVSRIHAGCARLGVHDQRLVFPYACATVLERRAARVSRHLRRAV